MKRFYAHFENGKVRETTSGYMIPISYDFWKPLMTYFIKRGTKFRLDCWSNETEGIERAGLLGCSIIGEIGNLRIFEGKITEEFIYEIVENPFDKDGKIKWFSIFLKNKDDEIIFSSEHNGSEFVTGWISPKDVDFIKATVPQDFSFNIFYE
jgi:hypothetical protein